MTTILPISRIPTSPKPAAVPSLWNYIYDEIDDRLQALNEGKQDVGTGTAGLASLESPALTGTPTAPTPSAGNSSAQLATTQFVGDAITDAIGDIAFPDTGGLAPLASPTFTGLPKGPTPTTGDASEQLATTAFVGTSIAGIISTRPGHTYTESDWAWIDKSSGFKIQWGTFSLPETPGSEIAVTFTTAFSTIVIGSWIGGTGAASEAMGSYGESLSGMTVAKGNSDTAARAGKWYAIGF